MYVLCTEQTHSANSTSRDSLIAWITWIFQKQSCYSCCYGLSKQDVLGFSSSQQPGPPTQTVYLRVELNLCDYSLLTSYNHPSTPPLPPPFPFQARFWQLHWAPPRESHTFFSAQFALIVVGSPFGNLPAPTKTPKLYCAQLLDFTQVLLEAKEARKVIYFPSCLSLDMSTWCLWHYGSLCKLWLPPTQYQAMHTNQPYTCIWAPRTFLGRWSSFLIILLLWIDPIPLFWKKCVILQIQVSPIPFLCLFQSWPLASEQRHSRSPLPASPLDPPSRYILPQEGFLRQRSQTWQNLLNTL